MDEQTKIEAVARAAHEANRAYCLAFGDTSQPSWEGASEELRASKMRGVVTALVGTTPPQQHEAWMADRRSAGWVFGPTKDVEKKTHPCLVPYEELPRLQQAKDMLFICVVRCTAAALGMRVTYSDGNTRDWSTTKAWI